MGTVLNYKCYIHLDDKFLAFVYFLGDNNIRRFHGNFITCEQVGRRAPY